MQTTFDYQHLGYSQALNALYWRSVDELGFRHSASFHIETLEDDLSKLQADDVDIIATSHTRTKEERLVAVNGCILLMGQSFNSLVFALSANTAQERDALEELIRTSFPAMTIPEGHRRFDFWYWTQNDGATCYSSPIEVYEWAAVRENYTPEIQTAFDKLVSPEFQPGLGGQFILFQGEGGTGKTVATSALVDSWKDWAKPVYITDSEEFFNNTAYMLHIFLEASRWGDPDKWSLVIIEDAGELVAHDAKHRTGAALGRFLNLTNGLLGKGFKSMFLLTTNDELKDINEAVARPGRCAARLDFGRFTKEAGTQWLADHGIEEKLDKELTLAELYAKVKGVTVTAAGRSKPKLGF